MEVFRYINGEPLKSNNPSDYTVECDIILQTIAQVNRRRQGCLPICDIRHSNEKVVEIV
jgi:hypothetical protein